MGKSVKVTAVMPEAVKNQLKEFADSRRWTMSQALVYFTEKGLIEELGSGSNDDIEQPQPVKNSKK